MRSALAVFGAFLLLSRAAAANLAADSSAVMQAWQKYSLSMRLVPRFLERGQPIPVLVPVELLDPSEANCATLAILGPPSTHFVLRLLGSEADPADSPWSLSSLAGALEVTRCGRDKLLLARLVLEMRSPRGLVEMIAAKASGPLPPLLEILPRRDPGTLPAAPDAGPNGRGPSIAVRLAQLQQRAQSEDAQEFQSAALATGLDGSGAESAMLAPGCHEIRLLEEPSSGNAASELELSVEFADAPEGLAVALGDPAAEPGTLCVAAPTPVRLHASGANPKGPVSVVHTRWDLPESLPHAWGPPARARMAQVLRSHRLLPKAAPIYESLGVQGSTRLPLETEPDACYAVAVVPMHGEVQVLALAAEASQFGASSQSVQDTRGTTTAFCARGATHAVVSVESRGLALAWLVAVWEMGRAPPGILDD